MNKKIKGVIFDLDGTLLNTLPDITGAVNSSLAECKLKPRSEQEIAGFIFGGEKNLINMAMPDDIDESLKEEVLHRFRFHYQARLTYATQEYTGISRLLFACARKGVRMAVLSNKPEKYTIPIISHYFPALKFYSVQGSTGELTKKPKPIKALQIAAKMRLPPQSILFIGDTITDLKTARNAGMQECLVSWGFRSPQVLKTYYPRKIVFNSRQLENYILQQ